ncbi:MAG: hypothetical protein U0414_42990 [Polyangiaceae bacterium]
MSEVRTFIRIVAQPDETPNRAIQRLGEYLAGFAKPDREAEYAYGELLEIDSETKRVHAVGARNYVVVGPSPVTEKDIESAAAILDKGPATVAITFTADAASRLEKFTTDNTYRRIALVVDGFVVSAPMVTAPITGGAVSLTFGAEEATEVIGSRPARWPRRSRCLRRRDVPRERARDVGAVDRGGAEAESRDLLFALAARPRPHRERESRLREERRERGERRPPARTLARNAVGQGRERRFTLERATPTSSPSAAYVIERARLTTCRGLRGRRRRERPRRSRATWSTGAMSMRWSRSSRQVPRARQCAM